MKRNIIIALITLFFCANLSADSDVSSDSLSESVTPDSITGLNIRGFIAPDSNGAYSPKKALMLSAITPGLGHLYVRKPLKALIYFGAEVYHIQQAWHFHQLYKHVAKTKEMVGSANWLNLSRDEKEEAIIDSTGHDVGMAYWRPEERRNKRLWWCVGIYVMAMLDAYVDAHLSDFPEGDLEFINNEKLKSRGVRLSFPINRR